MKKINVLTWFSKRQMDFLPNHFVTTKTNLTEESKRWIEENLSGRWYINQNTLVLGEWVITPAFEDPQEAILYELTWS